MPEGEVYTQSIYSLQVFDVNKSDEIFPHTEPTIAENFIVDATESVDGGSASGSEADPKGKRFLPWISSDGSDGTAHNNVTGNKGIAKLLSVAWGLLIVFSLWWTC